MDTGQKIFDKFPTASSQKKGEKRSCILSNKRLS